MVPKNILTGPEKKSQNTLFHPTFAHILKIMP